MPTIILHDSLTPEHPKKVKYKLLYKLHENIQNIIFVKN